MGNKIKVIHLTDLHVGEHDEETLPVFNNAMQSLMVYLKEYAKSEENKDCPMYVVIGGDLLYQGGIKQGSKGELDKKILKPLKRIFKSANILAAYGNHDVNRKKLKEFLEQSEVQKLKGNFIKKVVYNPKKNVNEEYNYPDYEKAAQIVSLNNDMLANLESTCFINYLGVKFKAGKKSKASKKENEYFTFNILEEGNIAFVILNSAWFCLYSEADIGLLTLGPGIVQYIETRIGKLKEKNPDLIVITVMHHPFNWHFQNDINNETGNPSVFDKVTGFSDIILTGHEHGSPYDNYLNRKSYNLVSGTTFHFSNPDTGDISPVYFSIIEVDTEQHSIKRETVKYSPTENKWVLKPSTREPMTIYRPRWVASPQFNLWKNSLQADALESLNELNNELNTVLTGVSLAPNVTVAPLKKLSEHLLNGEISQLLVKVKPAEIEQLNSEIDDFIQFGKRREDLLIVLIIRILGVYELDYISFHQIICDKINVWSFKTGARFMLLNSK